MNVILTLLALAKSESSACRFVTEFCWKWHHNENWMASSLTTCTTWVECEHTDRPAKGEKVCLRLIRLSGVKQNPEIQNPKAKIKGKSKRSQYLQAVDSSSNNEALYTRQ